MTASQLISRSTSLPNLDGKHGIVTANAFLNGTPYIRDKAPEAAYDFLKELGRGKYATTWLVRRRSSGRNLACKEILKGSTESSWARAKNEAEIHSNLNGHPNIAGLVEIWEDRNSFYMFMELCRGGELYHAISERGSLTEREAALVLKVVLQVIQYCHSKGVLHRDVKPENFMLKCAHGRLEKNNILAIDFGCSCFASPSQKVSEVVGSPMYLAPEAVAGLGYGFQADIWSAGVLLFSMLSGLSLFEASTDEQICWSVLNQSIDLEGDPWPFVSREAKDLLAKLLERNPEERVSIHDALNSVWMHSLTAPSRQPLNLLVVDRLQAFAEYTGLQRLLLNVVVASQPPSGPKQHLQRLFDDMDVDGDGLLSPSELQWGLQDMGEISTDASIEDLMASLDILQKGGVQLNEFLAAACDKRCQGGCCLAASPAVQQMVQAGCIDLEDFADLLSEFTLAMPLSAVLRLILEAGVSVEGSLVKLQDLEDHLGLCRPLYQPDTHPGRLQGCHEEDGANADLGSPLNTAESALDEDKLREVEANMSNTDSCDLCSESPFASSQASPSVRSCSPELSQPFFFQQRRDEEKAGGIKSAGPLFPEGGSPPASESAWARMLLDRSRGRSPDSIGGASDEGSGGLQHSTGFLLGSSPNGSISSTQDAFTSGGVTYWTPREEDWSDCDRETEEEDSDALFGAALTGKGML